MRKLLAGLALAAALPLVGMRSPKPQPVACDLVPTNVSASVDEYGYVTISGRIKNTKGWSLRYVAVHYNLYDKSDARVGSAWDNVVDLGAGEVWKFKATGLHGSRYRLSSVECRD